MIGKIEDNPRETAPNSSHRVESKTVKDSLIVYYYRKTLRSTARIPVHAIVPKHTTACLITPFHKFIRTTFQIIHASSAAIYSLRPGVSLHMMNPATDLYLELLALLLLNLEKQSAVDVREDTTEGNGGADQGIEFLVSANGELKMARGDTLDLEILGGVSGKLEDFGGEILEDGRHVDRGLCANAHLVLSLRLQEALNTTAWELEGVG